MSKPIDHVEIITGIHRRRRYTAEEKGNRKIRQMVTIWRYFGIGGWGDYGPIAAKCSSIICNSAGGTTSRQFSTPGNLPGLRRMSSVFK